MKAKFLVLLFMACSAPLLAAGDNAAQTRVKKAAEYRDTKETVEQPQPAQPSETEGKRQDTPKEEQPSNKGESFEKMLDGLFKSGEPSFSIAFTRYLPAALEP